MAESLKQGALSPRTAHLCIDMQRLFAEDAPWATPWIKRVLPVVTALARARPQATVFTRFIPPRRAAELPGAWQGFYARWAELTLERIDPRLLELMPELAALRPPAMVFDKTLYSAFHDGRLHAWLQKRSVDTLVFSGAETDVCVLAAVLDAVDLGYRVVLARDALCSSSDATHDALMTLYQQRFSQQIEVADTAEILELWQAS